MARKKKCPRCPALKGNLSQCKKRNCKPQPYCYVHSKSGVMAQTARKRQLMSAYYQPIGGGI